MKDLFDLFLTFARIGGFTFGGGYAMLPMLQKELVDKKKWATEETLLDYYAIAQGTFFRDSIILTGYEALNDGDEVFLVKETQNASEALSTENLFQ